MNHNSNRDDPILIRQNKFSSFKQAIQYISTSFSDSNFDQIVQFIDIDCDELIVKEFGYSSFRSNELEAELKYVEL